MSQIDYLSDLNWITVNSVRKVIKDANVQGDAMSLNGKIYAKGLGTYSESTLSYRMDGQYSRFIAMVGPDDAVLSNTVKDTSVIFRVYGDDMELFNSGEMRTEPYHPPKKVDVSLDGIQILKLCVESGQCERELSQSNWANWGDARVVKKDVLINSQHNINNSSYEFDILMEVDKTELNPLLYPLEKAQISISVIMKDGEKADLKNLDAIVRYTTESIYKSGRGEVATVNQKGVVTPQKGGIVKVTAELTYHGIVRSSYINLTVRPFYHKYHETLTMKMFMGQNKEVKINFEQALSIIKKMNNLTRGIPKIIYLTGWQYDGHDSGYPAWNQVNIRLKRPQDTEAVESLKWLMAEAKKYNTIVSLHINMLDASEASPLWEEYREKDILARNADGTLRRYLWGYTISYAREWELGLTQRRIDHLCEMLPLKEAGTIHIDAFHSMLPTMGAISPYHEEKYGYSTEVEEETQRKIFEYWCKKGMDLTSEFVISFRNESFIGLQPLAWHFDDSPFNYLEVPACLYCGGDGGDRRYGESMLGEDIISKDPEGLNNFLHEFCTKTLPWYFLNKLRRLEDDGIVVTFTENVQSYLQGSEIIIKQNDEIIQAGEEVFIPALWCQDREIIAYSKKGYELREWKLPNEWGDVKFVDIWDIQLEGYTHIQKNVAVKNNRIRLALGVNQAVAIVPIELEPSL